MAFSPGGGLLAAANQGDDTVSVFSVNQTSGALTQVPGSPFATEGPGSPFVTGEQPDSVAFSPSGGLLATAGADAPESGDASVFAVNSATGALSQVPGSPFPTGSNLFWVAFSPSGGLLATASDGDDTVSVFSVNQTSGALTPVSGSPFAAGVNPISVAFSPDGGLLASANDDGDGTVSVFSVNQTSGALTPVSGSPFAAGVNPISVAFSPDGGLLATANRLGAANSNDGSVSVYFAGSTGGAPGPGIKSPPATLRKPSSLGPSCRDGVSRWRFPLRAANSRRGRSRCCVRRLAPLGRA